MKIAIIGAGPAGLISACHAIKAGHSVVLFEKNARIGGIWDPWSGGAYRNACMQNSQHAFHYINFPPGHTGAFPDVLQVFEYLKAVTRKGNVGASTRLNTEVISVGKDSGRWLIRSVTEGKERDDVFDNVIIAIGELWRPRKLALSGMENFSGALITCKEYQEPEAFKGKNILIIGGGVSGADIASELVPFARLFPIVLAILSYRITYLPYSFPST